MSLPMSYHWRHLLVRKTTTVLTVLVVGAVVGVLAWMLGFTVAMYGSLSTSTENRKLIVIRRGATAESNSAIPVDEFNKLTQVTGVATSAKTGEPLISPELMTQVWLPRLRDGGKTRANVAVRGVTDKAFEVHRSVKLLGDKFSSGVPEVVVGVSAARQFEGLQPGNTVNLGFGGDRVFKIVGLFTADGGPMESEIWGYLPALLNAYGRNLYSSASLLLKEDADPKAAVEQIAGPAIEMDARTEAQYWSEQSRTILTYLKICYALVTVMCFAAVFAIANTMYSTVAGRTREIAMLRTIGFGRGQIITGFLIEAVMISILGGVTGCLACLAWLTLAGNTKDMFGANTFTALAFEIRVTPLIVAVTLLAVMLVGAFGALFPAVRAARVQVVTALREA